MDWALVFLCSRRIKNTKQRKMLSIFCTDLHLNFCVATSCFGPFSVDAIYFNLFKVFLYLTIVPVEISLRRWVKMLAKLFFHCEYVMMAVRAKRWRLFEYQHKNENHIKVKITECVFVLWTLLLTLSVGSVEGKYANLIIH